MKLLKTQRLVIKPFSDGDQEKLSELLVNEEIKKTFMIPDLSSQDALGQMVNALFSLSSSCQHFTRGIYVGNHLIGFVNDVAIENDCIELGYVIHPDNWANGFATEMLSAVIQALLNSGFSTIRAGAFCENHASIRVMEKCGMERTTLTECIEYRGTMHTCVYYEIKGI